MKKFSISLIAVLAIVFATASAFKSSRVFDEDKFIKANGSGQYINGSNQLATGAVEVSLADAATACENPNDVVCITRFVKHTGSPATYSIATTGTPLVYYGTFVL